MNVLSPFDGGENFPSSVSLCLQKGKRKEKRKRGSKKHKGRREK